MMYMKPPPEAHNGGQIWLLKKCPCCLADAGRHWYIRIMTQLKRLVEEFCSSLTKQCLFGTAKTTPCSE